MNQISDSQLLDTIEQLAGPQRNKTFRAFAEFILHHNIEFPVETGCYRGIEADGQSTIILGLLAKQLRGMATSIDINPVHIARAKELVAQHDLIRYVDFVCDDSVIALRKLGLVRAIYVDSMDHIPENPGPCQRHELAELGALYGALKAPCAILLDDNVPETGGKPLLGRKFLEDRGWQLKMEAYQLLYTLE